jgi:hypothetical protein
MLFVFVWIIKSTIINSLRRERISWILHPCTTLLRTRDFYGYIYTGYSVLRIRLQSPMTVFFNYGLRIQEKPLRREGYEFRGLIYPRKGGFDHA